MRIQDLPFGVEIETIGQTRERVAEAIRSVVGGAVRHDVASALDPWQVAASDGRIWKVVADGSLQTVPSHLRAEIVTPVLGYEDLPALQAVVRAARAAGSRCDASCGLHCHVSADAFDGRTLGNLAKLVYKQEALIFAALRVRQARLDRYTKPIPAEFIQRIERERPRTRDELNQLWYGFQNTHPERYHSSRYHAVNLHSVFYRNTVEYRMGEGTLHAGRIKAYVQFVLALTAKALNSRAASSRKRTFEPASARYDFRVFLLRLGMVGNEFKTARKHLLAAMPGDSAFKNGRPKGPKPKDAAPPTAGEATSEAAGATAPGDPEAPAIEDPAEPPATTPGTVANRAALASETSTCAA